MNESYIGFKNKFDSSLVDHFPEKLIRLGYSLSFMTDIRKDNIGLYLYQYNVPKIEIDSLVTHLEKRDYLHKYNSSEDCLLKVNPFETIESLESYDNIKLEEGIEIERSCYADKLPIPNFVDFQKEIEVDIWQEDEFDIYVFQAEKGIFYNGLEVASQQMPKEWGNGYSKGMAISKQHKIVMYWMVIW
ncbi:hypothetical protein ACYSNM_12720 [Myroides sp. LJL116]